MKPSTDYLVTGVSMALLATWAACTPPAKEAAAPPPPPAAYQPNFAYKAPDAGKKLDVTIGVVNPIFTNEANARTAYLGDAVVKGMLSAMSATFNEVLIAKGFNTKGPYPSLNDMTFPDKKGSDLLLYAQFDYDVNVEPGPPKQAPPPAQAESSMFGGLIKTNDGKQAPPPPVVRKCDVTLTVVGNVQFVAQEPLSGERMFNKRLDLSGTTETILDQEGAACVKGTQSGAWAQPLKDAWAKAHESVYQSSMKAFDSYVNGEEFQGLKSQSQELRAKKAY